MKYLCLVYSNELELHSLPDSPKDAECMAYAESIQSLDTSGVEPMRHAIATGSFREDVARDAEVRESALGSAPDAGDGLFRVPRVLP